MRIPLATLDPEAEALLPPTAPDGSGIGINYADRWLAVLKKVTLPDGRRLRCRRKGLRVTLQVGDRRGTGLMRRLVHGPDPRDILRAALDEAAADAGVTVAIDGDTIVLVT